MRFEALLRAHGFMKTEQPPQMWEADAEDIRFVPLLGEMIARPLSRGAVLDQVLLSVANVVVTESRDGEGGRSPRPGEYVAVTVSGEVDLGPDETWTGAMDRAGPLLSDLHERLTTAGVAYAYVRRLPSRGSITVFLKRLTTSDARNER